MVYSLPTLPSIRELLGGKQVGEETDVYSTFPQDERDYHNILEPEKCRCYPQIWEFTDEDDEIYMILIDHMWSI